MKKIILLLVLGFLIVAQATAQENKLRKKYRNLSFSKVEMKQTDAPSLKSNYGAAFTTGRTYFMHKKPIVGMLRFGIDATWFDINYNNYKIEYRYRENQKVESETTSFHQAEIGVQVGPSLSVNPISKLNIHAYFRYAPSFSILYANEAVMGGYAGCFVGGGAVSYGAIGLGVETRFGEANYKTIFDGEELNPEGSSAKRKFSGMRVYLTFRF